MENFVIERLRRKIDAILVEWSANKERMPLIIKGARQIGKTEAISHFAGQHYQNVIAINFVLQKEYRSIFDDGYEVESILRNISFLNPALMASKIVNSMIGSLWFPTPSICFRPPYLEPIPAAKITSVSFIIDPPISTFII